MERRQHMLTSTALAIRNILVLAWLRTTQSLELHFIITIRNCFYWPLWWELQGARLVSILVEDKAHAKALGYSFWEIKVQPIKTIPNWNFTLLCVSFLFFWLKLLLKNCNAGGNIVNKQHWRKTEGGKTNLKSFSVQPFVRLLFGKIILTNHQRLVIIELAEGLGKVHLIIRKNK